MSHSEPMPPSNTPQAVPFPFGKDSPRPLPRWLFLTLIMFWVGMAGLFTLVIFPDSKTWFYPGWWVGWQTHGLINLTLIANLLLLSGTLLLVLGPGGQRFPDFGWNPAVVASGFLGALAVFLLIEGVQVVVLLAKQTPIEVNPRWISQPLAAAGDWLGQILGNCLFEETAYRGILLGQIWVALGSRLSAHPRTRLALVFLLSQAIFAAIHIPVNFSRGAPLILLLGQFASGLIFAWLYWRTGNLWFTLWIHAFFNKPAPPFVEVIPGGMIAGLGVLLGLIVWEIWLFLISKWGPKPG